MPKNHPKDKVYTECVLYNFFWGVKMGVRGLIGNYVNSGVFEPFFF